MSIEVEEANGTEVKFWTEPRKTANSKVLLEHLSDVIGDGSLNLLNYTVVGMGPDLEVLNHETGNRYRITVEQISGIEK